MLQFMDISSRSCLEVSQIIGSLDKPDIALLKRISQDQFSRKRYALNRVPSVYILEKSLVIQHQHLTIIARQNALEG